MGTGVTDLRPTTVATMSTMHDVHAANRTWIVDTLRGLDDAGWAASTLCVGWDVEDLAAHLVARERHQVAAAGIVVPALHWMHERAMAKEAARGRDALVSRLAAGPPLGRLSDWANALEYWIHAEDLARGGLAIRREPPTGAAAGLLWKILARNARLGLRRVGTEGILAVTDTDAGRSVGFRLGTRLVRGADPDDADATIAGTVGELTLWLSGRRDAATVEITPADTPFAIEVQTVRLGV